MDETLPIVSGPPLPPDPVADAAAVAALLRQRLAARAELARLHGAIAALTGRANAQRAILAAADAGLAGLAGGPPARPEDAPSLAATICAVLAARPGWYRAGGVRANVEVRLGRALSPQVVIRALHALHASRRIRRRGSRGASLYAAVRA